MLVQNQVQQNFAWKWNKSIGEILLASCILTRNPLIGNAAKLDKLYKLMIKAGLEVWWNST